MRSVRRAGTPYGNRFPLAGLLFALAGCAAERSVLTADPGLTAEALRADTVAVVGVTVVNEVEQVRPPLVAALESILRNARPDVALRPADAVRDVVGLADYRSMPAAYQASGEWSERDATALAARLGSGVRFALLARVEKDAIHYSIPSRGAGSPYGAPASNVFSPQRVRRDTSVRLTLYDLRRNRVAWNAVYASSSNNARPDSVAVAAPPPPVVLGVPGRREQTIPEPPPPPPLAEAVVEGFRAFIADLPGGAAPSTGAPRP